MDNEKINVKFNTLVQYYETVINSMIATIPNGETLYTDVDIPKEWFDKNGNWIDETAEKSAEKYGYEELKAGIIEQAIEEGINPGQLEFC